MIRESRAVLPQTSQINWTALIGEFLTSARPGTASAIGCEGNAGQTHFIGAEPLPRSGDFFHVDHKAARGVTPVFQEQERDFAIMISSEYTAHFTLIALLRGAAHAKKEGVG